MMKRTRFFKPRMRIGLNSTILRHNLSTNQPFFRSVPAGNHCSCIHNLGLEICLQECNYHNSLQTCLIEGIAHWKLRAHNIYNSYNSAMSFNLKLIMMTGFSADNKHGSVYFTFQHPQFICNLVLTVSLFVCYHLQ